jgi:hypothetical protein
MSWEKKLVKDLEAKLKIKDREIYRLELEIRRLKNMIKRLEKENKSGKKN